MTQQAKFVLVGPHEGKTMHINNHQFIDGEYTFSGAPAEIVTLTQIFSFYSAFPADTAELMQLRADKAAADAALGGQTKPQVQHDASLTTVSLKIEVDTTDATASLEKLSAQAQATQADLAAALGEEAPAPAVVTLHTGAPDDAPDGMPTLAEAVGTLDPEQDTHWTSNNLPSLDHLSVLLGKKPTRGEVEAVADGYTRAKARAARG